MIPAPRQFVIPHPLRRLPAAGFMLLMALGLAGCSWFDDEEILAGERLPVRQERGENAPELAVPRTLPPAQPRADWPQRNGGPTRNAGHLSGPTGLALAWSVDAGTGDSDDSVITAGPVVAGGRVYVLDAAAEVGAFDAATGEERWRTSLMPEGEDDGEEGFGGGLAAEGARLYATTGFGEVLALDAASGEVLWRRRFGAPFRAPPAVAGGRVIAVTRTSVAVALDAVSGDVLWRDQGVGADTGFLGGAAPAIAGGGAVIPYSSGELVALDLRSGRRFWAAVMTGGRRGLARSAITDLTGDPLVLGPLVISANQSGRTAALEAASGRRVWTRGIGSTRPLWGAGDTLLIVSDAGELMRLDAGSGTTLWSRALPVWEDEEDREDPIGYSGPALVSGRVLLTDSIGNIWSFDAQTGQGEVAGSIPGGSITGFAVAGGLLYLVSADGVLHAYR